MKKLEAMKKNRKANTANQDQEQSQQEEDDGGDQQIDPDEVQVEIRG